MAAVKPLSTGTVSYTHLDVYKRQIGSFAIRLIKHHSALEYAIYLSAAVYSGAGSD